MTAHLVFFVAAFRLSGWTRKRGNQRLPVVEESQELQDRRVKLIRLCVMQMDLSAVFIEGEFAIVVGESALGHHQVAQMHLRRIPRADAGHDGKTRLALLQYP